MVREDWSYSEHVLAWASRNEIDLFEIAIAEMLGKGANQAK